MKPDIDTYVAYRLSTDPPRTRTGPPKRGDGSGFFLGVVALGIGLVVALIFR